MEFLSLKDQLAGTGLEGLAVLDSPEYLADLRHGDLPRWLAILDGLPDIRPSAVDLRNAVVIGAAEDCDPLQRAALMAALQSFIPWRKGPFELFGIQLDSEWRCQMKWDRLVPHLDDLHGRRVLDVGCGNGYYGLRLCGAGAEQVVGLEPHLPYVMQFRLLKRYLSGLPCHVLPAPLEAVPPDVCGFDTVLSMGVIYHHRKPIDHLMSLRRLLRPQGQLLLETLVVDGEAGYCLTPQERYARMPNVRFVPSVPTAVGWLKQCGFNQIDLADQSITTIQEQRQTQWMPFDSLAQALNPADNSLTIERLPAPRRALFTCSVA